MDCAFFPYRNSCKAVINLMHIHESNRKLLTYVFIQPVSVSALPSTILLHLKLNMCVKVSTSWVEKLNQKNTNRC